MFDLALSTKDIEPIMMGIVEMIFRKEKE